MLELYIFLRGLAMGLVLVLIMLSVLARPKHYTSRIFAFFAVGIMGYISAPLTHGYQPAFFISTSLADTIPLAFLLFVQAVFDDHSKPQFKTLVFGLTYLLVGHLSDMLEAAGLAVTAHWVWFIGRFVMLAVLAATLFVIARHWRDDLVEKRRFFRSLLVVVVGVYIIGVSVVESLTSANQIPMWVELVHSAGIALSSVIFAWGLITLGPAELAEEAEAPEPLTVKPNVDEPELEQIVAAMRDQQQYKDMELSIRSFADKLTIPEHRLRQHINQQLGYRNFNDFLNRYRVADAATRLRDIDEARLPILTIAMDAGYRSMTTFNKAFKSIKGVTPKEYRQNHQSNS